MTPPPLWNQLPRAQLPARLPAQQQSLLQQVRRQQLPLLPLLLPPQALQRQAQPPPQRRQQLRQPLQLLLPRPRLLPLPQQPLRKLWKKLQKRQLLKLPQHLKARPKKWLKPQSTRKFSRSPSLLRAPAKRSATPSRSSFCQCYSPKMVTQCKFVQNV